ncbi:thermonuclease family protein [Paenibacillus radicis (ex Xue et al. 2023)]|uniref:Thermonuclease family protein n=1 Tax=Paenibacillus radicis (ex Xue et al. 2023) TaxID=2972489 RepID=A0ABT1YK91_9BACL|nr:thermonuclease family protein [Paenibacillus radicis (ex Xue et al. 2023)]MCR8633602.1 thermonuclease family protein [Paenibacillus radicis (ex Xue et al. 2023)]
MPKLNIILLYSSWSWFYNGKLEVTSLKKQWIAAALLPILLLTMLLSGCQSKSTSTNSGRESVKIDRVVDGDTFEIKLNGKKEKVRLIGVDTPETKKPNTPVMFYGKEASDFTKKRLENKTVELEWDVERKDKYDRLLAYVWVEDELFNRTLVKEGYARIATFPPNVKYVDLFKKDQEEARNKQKGLWKDYDSAFEKKK